MTTQYRALTLENDGEGCPPCTQCNEPVVVVRKKMGAKENVHKNCAICNTEMVCVSFKKACSEACKLELRRRVYAKYLRNQKRRKVNVA